MDLILSLVGVVLVVIVLAVYSSIRVVEEGTLEALLVFGKMEGVLRPGLNVVPPFVSKTCPIDPRTMMMDTGDDAVAIPEEFEDDVRELLAR